jgi:hypothetical protein
MSLKLQQKRIFRIDLEDYEIEKRIEKKLAESESEEEVLVFGSNDGIYIPTGNCAKRIYSTESDVTALEVYKGELYYGKWNGEIRGASSYIRIAKRDYPVLSLKVWNGELYDADWNGEIHRTEEKLFSGTEYEFSPHIALRRGRVYALEVWNGELHDVGEYGKIYRTRDSKVIIEEDEPITYMRVWNGELYYVVNGRKIRRAEDRKVIIEENNESINKFEVWNGEFYYVANGRKIRRAEDRKVIVDLGKPIFCMRAVPRSVLKGLI